MLTSISTGVLDKSISYIIVLVMSLYGVMADVKTAQLSIVELLVD